MYITHPLVRKVVRLFDIPGEIAWPFLYHVARYGICFSSDIKDLKRLGGCHSGDKCFIIGNGPSLSISDLELLKGKPTFAANKIYLSFDQTDWRPWYYVVEDPLVLLQNYEAINNLSGFRKFLSYKYRILIKKNQETTFFNMSTPSDHNFPKFSFSPSRKIFCGNSVVYTCLQLAVHMGFDDIYLIGVDFSFDLPDSRDSDEYMHQDSSDSNHFSDDYRSTNELWNPPMLDRQKAAFRLAEKLSRSRSFNIYNASRNTELDVFERRNLDNVV